MDNIIKYHTPVTVDKTKFTTSYWYEGVKCYDQGKYIEAIRKLLKYMNTANEVPEGDGIDINLYHGSSKIHIKADSKEFYISADFLEIPDTAAKIPLMRQVLELNFSYLVLSRILLKENKLYFEYRDKIENTDPNKLFYIIDEICFCSDKHDDFFIDKFKAKRVSSLKAVSYTEEEKEKAYSIFTETLEQGIKYTEFYINKRYFSSACDILSITLMKLNYTIQPQGLVYYEIKQIFDNMYVKGKSAEETANSTLKKIKKLLEFEKEKFYSDCFHPQYILSPKRTTELGRLQNDLEAEFNKIKDFYANKDHFNTVLYCLYNIYYVFYNDLIPDNVYKNFEEALKNSNSKKWEDASVILYEAFSSVMKMGASDTDRVRASSYSAK